MGSCASLAAALAPRRAHQAAEGARQFPLISSWFLGRETLPERKCVSLIRCWPSALTGVECLSLYVVALCLIALTCLYTCKAYYFFLHPYNMYICMFATCSLCGRVFRLANVRFYFWLYLFAVFFHMPILVSIYLYV